MFIFKIKIVLYIIFTNLLSFCHQCFHTIEIVMANAYEKTLLHIKKTLFSAELFPRYHFNLFKNKPQI